MYTAHLHQPDWDRHRLRLCSCHRVSASPALRTSLLYDSACGVSYLPDIIPQCPSHGIMHIISNHFHIIFCAVLSVCLYIHHCGCVTMIGRALAHTVLTQWPTQRLIDMRFPSFPADSGPVNINPIGWRWATDPQGKTYYLNDSTQTTTYEPPPPVSTMNPPPWTTPLDGQTMAAPQQPAYPPVYTSQYGI